MNLPAPKFQPISDVSEYVRSIHKNLGMNFPSAREIHKSLHDALCAGTIEAIGNHQIEGLHLRNQLIRNVVIPKTFWVLYSVDTFEAYIKNHNHFPENLKDNYGSYYEDVRIDTSVIAKYFSPSEPTKNKKNDDNLTTRQRNTFLNLIIGLVIVAYEDVSVKASEIEDDLIKKGIKISDQTIHNILKEAREFAPRETANEKQIKQTN